MKKEKPGHQFPQNLLMQINENTAGFVLFTIDGNGHPCVYSKLDNQINEIGLHNFIRHYAETIETAHSNSVYTSVMGQEPDDE
jgi:hypothetical protein